MTNSDQKIQGALLIVDDREEVLRALERFMSLYFETVFVALSPAEAEAQLREHAPPFLLCDFWLGGEHPPSTALIPGWRREFRSLVRVVLMTGTKSSSIPPCPDVDAIFQKPLEMTELVAFFRKATESA